MTTDLLNTALDDSMLTQQITRW